MFIESIKSDKREVKRMPRTNTAKDFKILVKIRII